MSRVATIQQQLEELQKRAQDIMGGIEARANKEATDEENTNLKSLREKIVAKKEELKEAREMQSTLTELVKENLPAQKTEDTDHRAAAAAGEAAGGAKVDPNLKKEPVFRSAGEQLQAVWLMGNPTVDQRGKEKAFNMLNEVEKRAPSGLSTLSDPDGGYLIQPEFGSEILRNQFQVGQLAAKCKKVPMLSNRLKMIALDDASRADGSRLGGVVAYWLNEADKATPSKPKLRIMDVSLDKLMAIGYATDELLTDAPALGSVMLDAFAQEFAFQIDEAIVWGNGTNKPLGILDPGYKGLLKIALEAGQDHTKPLLAQNLANMKAAMPAAYWQDAFWAINPEIRPTLDLLTLPVGTGGVPVFMPANNLSQDGFDTLYGRPILALEQCSGMNTCGDIMLLSLSNSYLLGKKGEIQTDASMHVRFEYAETAFRCQQRIGGQPIPNSPITPKRSSTGFKMSPFIALTTRS